MKTRHKITLLFSLIVTAILLVVSFSVYYFTMLDRQDMFKKRLKSRANNNSHLFSFVNDTSSLFLTRINRASPELLPKKSVEIYDSKGKLHYRYQTDPADSTGVNAQVIESAIINEEHFYKVGKREALAVYYKEGNDGIIVVVAAYDSDGWARLNQMKQIFTLSILIGMVITLLAGNLFSKQLLKPVAQIITEVNDISSHNLSHRIKAGKTQDELDQLASTFNELLNRLEEYFTAQRRFISNASHELSTPLTSISSQLEVTLQRNRTTDEYRQVMHSIHEDVVQMRQLTKSLLEIAKTGSEGSIELNEIRIDEVLIKVMGDIKKVNSEYVVELNFSDSAELESSFLVFGNTDLLYIAIKNLVENGCKYSPDHTSRVYLSFLNGSTNIEVKSNGDPIKKDELEKIFQPFYRSANSIRKTGFGLGLALAKRIVGLHKGTLEVISDNKTGTNFTITIPTHYTKV